MRIDTARGLSIFLREQRRAFGLTQGEMADRAGVSRRWLSDFEGGKLTAEYGLVLRVVQALDLTIEIYPTPKNEIDLDDLLAKYDAPRD